MERKRASSTRRHVQLFFGKHCSIGLQLRWNYITQLDLVSVMGQFLLNIANNDNL